MNKNNDRNQPQTIAPPTPNLQQYKLHGGRNKTKKKNTSPNIQPTLQPISAHHGIGYDKVSSTPTNMNMNHNNKHIACYNHPQRKAMYFARDNSKKSLCGLCAVTDGGGDSKFLDTEKYEKTKEIEAFKKKISSIKQSILNRQKQMQQIMHNQSNYFGECVVLLNQQFTNIIQDIQQKHKQLNNSLAESMLKRKQTIQGNFMIMSDVKQSIERYIYDINKNYQEILEELSIEHFRDIMKQYNAKIQYYNENILKKLSRDQQLKNSINLYIPMQQLRRVIDKANVQYLGFIDNLGSPKSLQKFMSNQNQTLNYNQNTGKASRNIINERNQRNNHDRKSQSKLTTQNRKRNNTNNIIHPIKGANKQNFYNDSYLNRAQYNEQYTYYDA